MSAKQSYYRLCKNCVSTNVDEHEEPCVSCPQPEKPHFVHRLNKPKSEEVSYTTNSDLSDNRPVAIIVEPTRAQSIAEDDETTGILISVGVLRRARQVMKDYISDGGPYISDVAEQEIQDDIYQIDQAIGDVLTTEDAVAKLEYILDAIEAKPGALNLKNISLYEFECIKDFIITLPRRIK